MEAKDPYTLVRVGKDLPSYLLPAPSYWDCSNLCNMSTFHLLGEAGCLPGHSASLTAFHDRKSFLILSPKSASLESDPWLSGLFHRTTACSQYVTTAVPLPPALSWGFSRLSMTQAVSRPWAHPFTFCLPTSFHFRV